ncbi:MAG TPA: DNA-processing protein DprA [Thermodesulfobacteriota bacterium]|nr:DNA-processing protein DprA [Thermodesulfobacteriota bacterium]
MDSAKIKYWLALARAEGLLRTTGKRLLERFGGPEVFFEGSSAGTIRGVPPAAERAIRGFDDWAWVERELELIERKKAGVLTFNDPAYPALLREIKDPPYLLYTRGVLHGGKTENTVAVEGTRNPTPYGLDMAEALSRDLAGMGVTVVSGLARGSDAAAHKGAIRAGGRTIAVLGTGVDVPYPVRNSRLYEEIERSGGLIVSELPLGTGPVPGNFLRRNRIINGISLAVVVVEATLRSGSLMTARLAFESGRKVFVTPGDNVNNEKRRGIESLMERGAVTIESAGDIMRALGIG